ncbi:MAG: glycosyltransferase [Nitrospinaceae bacterium]
MNLKILTFNWHEPYLCLLSRIGHEFLVAEPDIAPGHIRRWDENMRPVPANIRLVSLDQAREALNQGEIDLVIAHNVKDLVWTREYTLPKILVFHNRLTTEIALGKNRIDRETYLEKIRPLLENVGKVFISESKKQDWGLEGRVILPGLDVAEYGGYTGEKPCILRVGNLFRERDLMMGFSRSERLVGDHPSIVLGLNPSIPGSRLSRGFGDLMNHYRSCRLFLNSTVDDYEDGYNLAMLEAMAAGMPVVSTFNRTSPIRDGMNGYVSEHPDYLVNRVQELLNDREKAKNIGQRGKETVREKFGIEAFLRSWTGAVEESVIEFLERTGISVQRRKMSFHEKSKKNVLMNYVSYPVTTAFYLERALRKNHNVITCGPMISREVIDQWDLGALNRETAPHDISCDDATSLREILSRLPHGWEPDFFLWVETGLGQLPPDLDRHSFPRACYLIDTHLHLERHQEIARHFDFVFLAQKVYVEPMKASGCRNVFWLPLACDPEIHGKKEVPREYDVGFVGSVTPAHGRRKKLLEAIGKNFDLHLDRKFLEEMAEVFSRSKIVFNNAIKQDLNMRVFEALCSGTCLVTDPAPASGLQEFFEDGRHLALYQDETLVQTIRYYLDHPEERKRIGEAGRKEVLARHTYDHRVQFLIDTLNHGLREPRQPMQAGVQPDSYYQNVRHDILPLIPANAGSILEVGCAAGGTGSELKKRKGVFIAGVEMDPEAARQARQVLDDVIEGNIEELELPYAESSFDCILFADVLEHLVDPLSVLKKVKKLLKPGGTVVASIPNVQYFGLIHHLVEGNWTYQKEGILDNTHLRFFTFREIEKLFTVAGLEIREVDETLDPQYENFRNGSTTTLNIGRMSVRDLDPDEMRRFFVFQYKIAAQSQVEAVENPAPSVLLQEKDQLLRQAADMEKEKKFSGAISVYRRVRECFPDCPEAVVLEANCHMHSREPGQAEDLYREAVRMDENHAGARLGLGLLELQRGNLAAAVRDLESALRIQPENEKVQCGLGMAYRQAKRFKEAQDCFTRVLDRNMENLSAMTNLLELAYESGEFAESERVLRRYLKLHPANLNMLFGLAGVLFKMNRLKEAKETLDLILIFNPDHSDALGLWKCIESDRVQAS